MTMHAAMLVLFWSCFGVIAWVYFGYPLALTCNLFGGPRAKRPTAGAPATGFHPYISVIVPAHNEEAGIEAKLRNLLDANYPRDRIEILVGSDGSSDCTQEIVERFRDQGVGLISFPQQRGKSSIQNGLVTVASGSILVFTDADCLLPRNALHCLLQHFDDPRVGLVTGGPQYRNAGATPTAANEGLYLRYETWLRKLESDRDLLVVASGSLFAIRRSLWRALEPNQGDDFALPLRVARAHMCNVFEARACPLTDLVQCTPMGMLRLKVRVISKDFRALLQNRDLLNPRRHPRLAAALWSHKLLRWLVPYFLLALFAANISLLGQPFFQIALAVQSSFYSLAIAGLVAHERNRSRLASLPMSFCIVNCAAILGTLKCVVGRTSGLWEPERVVPERVDPRRSRVPAD